MDGYCGTWVPVKRLTGSPCHYDWMLGSTKFSGVTDFLTGKTLVRSAPVFWNRTLKRNVAVSSYRAAVAGGDAEALRRCSEIGLPPDIRV